MLYHVISRVVDRRFVLGTEEKEKFRTLVRMQEKFTGRRVLSYCLMDNHFHLQLEVPPMAEGGISDEVLLNRLSALYGEDFVDGVALELANARKAVYTCDTGLTPRSVLEKFAAVQMLDVHLPTTDAREIVLTRYTQPEKDLQLLLDQLQLKLPEQAPPKIQAPPPPPN